MSRSACDQCKVILMPIIIFVSRKQYFNIQSVGLLFHVKMNEFSEIYLNTFYIVVKTEIKLLRSSKTLTHVQVVNVSR